jgi:hypothetical protein
MKGFRYEAADAATERERVLTICPEIPAGKLHEKSKKDYHRARRDHREKFKIILCDLCGLFGFIKVYE